MHCDILKIQDGVTIVEKLSCGKYEFIDYVAMATMTLQDGGLISIEPK